MCALERCSLRYTRGRVPAPRDCCVIGAFNPVGPALGARTTCRDRSVSRTSGSSAAFDSMQPQSASPSWRRAIAFGSRSFPAVPP